MKKKREFLKRTFVRSSFEGSVYVESGCDKGSGEAFSTIEKELKSIDRSILTSKLNPINPGSVAHKCAMER